VPADDERNPGDKLKRASASDQRRDQRCGSAMGSKLVGGSRLVHHAERVEEEDQGKSRSADALSVLHVTVS